MAVEDFSDAAVNSYRSQDGSEQTIELLEIVVPGFATYRFANNGKAVTSNDVEFEAFPFRMPDTNESDSEPKTRIQFPSMTREAALAVRSTAEDINVRWWEVLQSDPDTVLRRFPNFVARNVEVENLIVSADLKQKDYALETYPPRHVDQVRFPGIYRTQS